MPVQLADGLCLFRYGFALAVSTCVLDINRLDVPVEILVLCFSFLEYT